MSSGDSTSSEAGERTRRDGPAARGHERRRDRIAAIGREFRRGLASTRPYLLAHHEPEEFDRCHALTVRDRTVRLCARCSGVYPGILAGLALVATGTGKPLWPLLVAVGPAPALADWAATQGDRNGSNAVRTATGLALGAAYAVGLAWLLTGGPLWLLAVAGGYGAAAATALAVIR